jgi:thioredoxin-like negative regulator of GroEL
MLAPTISSLAAKYAGKVIVCKVNLDRVLAMPQNTQS